jgi:hypothetical protein
MSAPVSTSGEEDAVFASPQLHKGLEQKRFSFVSCSSADGNRRSIRNIMFQ